MDKDMEYILSLPVNVLRIVRDACDEKIRRSGYVITSAEAKLKRVEPLSEEFNQTVTLIEDTRKKCDQDRDERALIHRKITATEWGFHGFPQDWVSRNNEGK